MVKKLSEMRRNTVCEENSSKGFVHLLENEETGGIFRLAAEVTLEPGAQVKAHSHENEGEIYIIVSGTATADDNGTTVELNPGDVMWTANGDYHALYNNSDKPMVMYALIAKE